MDQRGEAWPQSPQPDLGDSITRIGSLHTAGVEVFQ